MSWSCPSGVWWLFFESNTNPIGWPAGSTSNVDEQFNPNWKNLLLIRVAAPACPQPAP